MQRINPQMNKYKVGIKPGGSLYNYSGNPTVVHIRRISRIETVRTSEMQESE